MSTVVSHLLAVLLLTITVHSAPVPSSSAAATYYYEPIVPYGPYPAPGYVVAAYRPKYTTYRVVRYPPRNRKTEYEEDRYEDEEPKYYYGGKFTGVCKVDGLYYINEVSYAVCSNGYASRQPCPPGTKTDKFPSYKAGYYYGSSDLCSVNLVDFGFGPYSYMPQQLSYEQHETPSSYEQSQTATTYGPDQPHTDTTYQPSDNSYDAQPPQDPYRPPTYDSSTETSYRPSPSYPPASSYQPSDSLSQSRPSYVVEHQQPQGAYSYSTSNTGPYPPNTDSYSPSSSYEPSPPTNPYPPQDTSYSSSSSDTDHYYRPPPSYYAQPHPTRPDPKRDTGASESDH